MGSVRHRKDRNRFQLDYIDADGIRRRPFCAPGTTKAQATKQLREVEAGVRSGLAPVRTQLSTISIKEVSTQWYEARSKQWAPGTATWRHRIIRLYIKPHIGRHAIDLLTPEDIHAWLNCLDLKPNTLRAVHATLRGIYRWAIDQGLATRNPMSEVPSPKRPKAIPLYLTREEYQDLLEQVDGDVADAVILSVHSGLRPGELIALRWSDIQDTAIIVSRSWDEAAGRIGPPKGRKARRVPIHPEARAVLERRRRRAPRGRVLQLSYTTWRLAVTKALRKIGIEQGGPHLLRHTMASWWVQDGGSLLTLQRILGHSSIDMTLVYAHLAPDSTETEAARVWGLLGTKLDRAGAS